MGRWLWRAIWLLGNRYIQSHIGNDCQIAGLHWSGGCRSSRHLTSEVAIVEPSWVPGDNVQAICRAHRLGQHDSVLASFLYLPGTLDQRIMAAFRRKASEIAELQGDQINACSG